MRSADVLVGWPGGVLAAVMRSVTGPISREGRALCQLQLNNGGETPPGQPTRTSALRTSRSAAQRRVTCSISREGRALCQLQRAQRRTLIN